MAEATAKVLQAARVAGIVMEIGASVVPRVVEIMETVEVDATEAAAMALAALGDRRFGKLSPRTMQLLSLGIASLVEDLRKADGLPVNVAPPMARQGG
jgi:hypothetical protein